MSSCHYQPDFTWAVCIVGSVATLSEMSSKRLYYDLAPKQKLACTQEDTETEQQGINLMLVKQTFIIGRITTAPCLQNNKVNYGS